jgi:hypothetical protein
MQLSVHRSRDSDAGAAAEDMDERESRATRRVPAIWTCWWMQPAQAALSVWMLLVVQPKTGQ